MERPGVVIAGLSPHPPVVVPEVGGEDAGRARATSVAMMSLAREIVAARPDVLVLIGPHGPVFRDAIACSADPELMGDLSRFGGKNTTVAFKNDLEMAHAIAKAAGEAKAHTTVVMMGERERRTHRVDRGLDHGAVVPLYFLQKAGLKCPIVSVTMGYLPYMECYGFGMAVERAAESLGRRVAVLASGDLSHRLSAEAPSGFDPRGREFDMRVMEAVTAGDPGALLNIDEDLIDGAGECGLRPIVMMFGALDGASVGPRQLSYEGPFGVGYGVAVIVPGPADEGRRFFVRWRQEESERAIIMRNAASPQVKLARRTLETYVREGRRVSVSSDDQSLVSSRAGVFVTLKKGGQLRGCIGTTEATTDSVAEEIIQNAISSGIEDPRFPPVGLRELDELVYSVDVLGPAEPVGGAEDLDVETYGVIVERGYRRGLLLPDLEGIDSVEQQIAIAKQKAGIRADEDVKLYRFKVTRYR